MNIPVSFIPMGGIKDHHYLNGSQSVYVGSNYGKIVDSIITKNTNQQILFFDEVDKIDDKCVYNQLIHITDGTQNKKYTDNYF